MNWEQYRSVMETYAIKTDDMATEDAYFMATHMPFSQLEVYRGGRTSSAPTFKNEKEVFESLVCNPDNEHRLIIVRGDNGAGKSHLIRYLKAKFESSSSTIYDPNTEQLIFLRRLNNSVRGVFSQLIEQGVIKDSNIEAKLRKFVTSSDSKDESAYKTEILYAYIAAVRSDQTGKPYRPVICRDIASYLSDSRVSEYLLREGGAISRCYNMITAPSSQVLRDTTIFGEEDFNVSKIIKSVIKQGDPQASDFASTLKGDDEEIVQLVNYLNKFTRDVVQRCADISSESTKTVFAQLRKDLKKQGKNLTLFIEDFTGFTGIDSELITVLSTEHGGSYTDLCRVTAIIGITNAYYDQFRDNFTDRVTHQVSVTDRSYGTDDFLIQMAGRYLNAIYCEPDLLRKWNESGADINNLPISHFSVPCEWDSIEIGGKDATLYPFNRCALLRLYESLPVKSPRMFLKEVLRMQLKEYFDGKQYDDGWYFPLNPANVQMARTPHSSAIDRLETIPDNDKSRLKAIFALWGDGSATGLKEADGTITFGGINRAFLDDVGLLAFVGIGEIIDKTTGNSIRNDKEISALKAGIPQSTPESLHSAKLRHQINADTRDYQRFQKDITDWFDKQEPLKFDADYRSWLRTLVRGDSKQCGSINWQDIGVPAYIAEGRLADLTGYYIDDQRTPVNIDRAIVCMDRSPESRDTLLALNELNYAHGWDFDGAPFYQQRLITWLEKKKPQIVERVTAAKLFQGLEVPVLEWCLALQYLRACILGQKIDMSSPYTIVRTLFTDFKKDDSIKRETREWNDLIQFIQNHSTDFESALTLLRRASTTTMGAVHFSVDANSKSCYRANELVLAIEKLIDANWDIEEELPNEIPQKHMLFNPAALLKTMYAGIKKVVVAENAQISQVMEKLNDYIGELTQDNLITALASIQKLFSVFAANGILGSNDLKTKYETEPIITAKDLQKHIRILLEATPLSLVIQLNIYSGNSLNVVSEFLRDIQSIAQKAEQEESKAKNSMGKIGVPSNLEQVSEDARKTMDALYKQLEAMEVYSDVTDRDD